MHLQKRIYELNFEEMKCINLSFIYRGRRKKEKGRGRKDQKTRRRKTAEIRERETGKRKSEKVEGRRTKKGNGENQTRRTA